MKLRDLSKSEFVLLDFLVSESHRFASKDEILKNLKVTELSDGGMGSLRLLPDCVETRDSIFGMQASSCQFTDQDGVEVVASLNLDQHGNPYELDIWKTDFKKLIRIPENRSELRREK